MISQCREQATLEYYSAVLGAQETKIFDDEYEYDSEQACPAESATRTLGNCPISE